MKKGKIANIKEIAKRTNFSTATVSRVLNHPERVKEETRKIIQSEIERSNYVRNTLGMQLRTNKTHTIGLIHTNLYMNFYSNIAQGIEETVSNQNYSLIICNSGDYPEKEYKQLLMLFEKRVDGIIISPTSKKNLNLIKKIQFHNIPVCCIDRIYEGFDCDHITVDNFSSTYRATVELIKKGYRRIGFISMPISVFTGKQRLEGFLKALTDHDIPVNEKLIRYGNSDTESGRIQSNDLLSKEKIDCLFVANELMALGALQTITELRITIPKDIGFLMWDNPSWTQFYEPQISVISQPTYEIGSIAANTIINRINSDHSLKQDPLSITLKTKLILRET